MLLCETRNMATTIKFLIMTFGVLFFRREFSAHPVLGAAPTSNGAARRAFRGRGSGCRVLLGDPRNRSRCGRCGRHGQLTSLCQKATCSNPVGVTNMAELDNRISTLFWQTIPSANMLHPPVWIEHGPPTMRAS
jgi:hypothetical protein